MMMRRLPVFFFVAAMLAMQAKSQALDVELYGLEIDKKDFIGCDFVSGQGRHATIELGYSHGLVVGNQLWVFRDTDDGFRRLCDFKIIRVDRKTSVGTATLDVDLRYGDKFVLSADDLDLWRGRKREEQLRLTRIVRRNALGRYDTRDTALDGADLMEIVREKSPRYRDWKAGLRRFEKPTASTST